ncbi:MULTISPECIES: hypothetical protein [unclassified Beijerinckia]|uniref:hypothetical protein n=1 Tax=unclassified Beijerinckia TaxID=2638183 RepID=UPI00089C0DC6|nr:MULTISPECIES: hypothetical protein [unclassified Beijerinckia]MDH7799343.1 putative membrane protein [Beijerinckia sp. GAS462]SED46968.1 hypothetical protein SAMN05443249_5461 [Beijerinckia sp. 28-YEA-48]
MTYLWRLIFTIVILTGLAAVFMSAADFERMGSAGLASLICLAVLLAIFLPLELLCWKFNVELLIILAAPAIGYLLPHLLFVFAPNWQASAQIVSNYAVTLLTLGIVWALSYIGQQIFRHIRYGRDQRYPDNSSALTDDYIRQLGMLRFRKDATRRKD